MSSPKSNTATIKQKALDLGFSDIGISKADFLEQESQVLKKWLSDGFHGEMQYMENHFEKRTDPRKLVEGAKSVISVLLNYYPAAKQIENTYKISKYAYGKDYHYVIKDKLQNLFEFIQNEVGEVNGRIFVDSAPVMDKVWAAKTGLGWIGKNTNLISKKNRSFVFIGEIISDLELEYDKSVKDYCGKCTKCIDSCPTSALSPYKIDARKCISYLTIEHDGEIDAELASKMGNHIYGCDDCLAACPWNKFARPNLEPAFAPRAELLAPKLDDLLAQIDTQSPGNH